MLTFEEYVHRAEWLERIRIAPLYPWSADQQMRYFREYARKMKRGGPLFGGPYGDKSEWAGMCRNWYRNYLETGS